MEHLIKELEEIRLKQDALRTKWFSQTNGMRKRTQTEYNRMEELQEQASFLKDEILRAKGAN